MAYGTCSTVDAEAAGEHLRWTSTHAPCAWTAIGLAPHGLVLLALPSAATISASPGLTHPAARGHEVAQHAIRQSGIADVAVWSRCRRFPRYAKRCSLRARPPVRATAVTVILPCDRDAFACRAFERCQPLLALARKRPSRADDRGQAGPTSFLISLLPALSSSLFPEASRASRLSSAQTARSTHIATHATIAAAARSGRLGLASHCRCGPGTDPDQGRAPLPAAAQAAPSRIVGSKSATGGRNCPAIHRTVQSPAYTRSPGQPPSHRRESSA